MILARLAGALAALLLGAGAACAKPPVWIVRDADSELVLFGSMHLLPKGLDWRPAALDQALARADDLWFEIGDDPAVQGEVARLTAARGQLPPGQSLYGLLPSADAGRLLMVAPRYGLEPASLYSFEPWLVEILLSVAAYQKQGASQAEGVEQVLARAAPPGARRQALETPAEQIEAFAGAPRSEHIAVLSRTLKELADGAQDDDRTDAWLAGDLAAIDAESLQPLRQDAPQLFRRLVVDRNSRWTERLRQRLQGSGRTVVVVGIGHLIGPEGLPARLRALGYTVEGP